MKTFNVFISFIAGLCAIICIVLGIYYANKSTPNYNESYYYLLLCIINYLTCIYLDKND